MSAPLDFFRYRNGKLTTQGISLEEIARAVGTPTYVYSSEGFLSPLRELQQGLSAVDHLICFAVKSNSNLSILRLLSDAGAGMDLVSGGELYRALQSGVNPSEIVFSGVGKSREEMGQALKAGIFSFNVESVAELELLNSVAVAQGRKAPVALRFNPDVNPKTHPYISTGLKKNKFGLNRQEILHVSRAWKRYPGIDFGGLSIHIGSQILTLAPLKDSFVRTRALLEELDLILPHPLRFVDLGGGVGITYKSEKTPSLKKYCELIVKVFGPKAIQRPLKILIEPGRSLSGNAGVLLTRALYRKPRDRKDFLVVDAGMNDLLRPSLYGSYHEIIPVDQALARGQRFKTDLVGPVCESSDCFGTDRLLSKRVGEGDLLAILSAGAYGMSMSSNYNTRVKPAEVLVDANGYRVIRRRETLDELLRAERN